MTHSFPQPFDPSQLNPAGEDVRFSLNGVEYVIVRSDVFDRVKGLLEADHQELRQRLAAAADANGWDEPAMDAYDRYPDSP